MYPLCTLCVPNILTAVVSPNFQEMAKKKRKVEVQNETLTKESKDTAEYAEAMEERVKAQNAKLNKQEEMMECMDSCKDFAHALRTHSNTLKHLADTVTLDKDQSHALMSVAKIPELMLSELEHNYKVTTHQDQALSEMLMRSMFKNMLLQAHIERTQPAEAHLHLRTVGDRVDELFAGRPADVAAVFRVSQCAMKELNQIIRTIDIDIPEL